MVKWWSIEVKCSGPERGPFGAQFGPEKKFLSVFLTLVDSICLNLRIMIAGNGILQTSVI